MPSSTALASEFDAFLYARVGTEPNGCELTVVSLLARLDADPWGEAARLAAQQKDAAIQWLAQRIAGTPLSDLPGIDAPGTASRLVLLLPRQGTTLRKGPSSPFGGVKVSPWAILMIVGAPPCSGGGPADAAWSNHALSRRPEPR